MRFEKAMYHYQISMDVCPKYSPPVNNMGVLMERQNMSTIEIEKLYRKGIEIKPNDAKFYANLGRLLIKQNRTDEVIELLAMARSKVNHEMSSFLEMIQYLKKTNTTHAHSAYFGFVKSLCSSIEHFNYLEDCSKALDQPMQDILKKKNEQGEIKKAKMYKEIMKKIKAVDLPTMKSYARALSNAHTIEEAFTYMMNDIEESNKYDVIDESDDHSKMWQRALTMFRNQRYAESKELYETYINLHPKNLNAQGQYGALLFQTGQFERGEKILLQLIEEDEFCSLSGPWLNLATVYGRKQHFEEGINLLQKCLSGMSKQSHDNERYNKQLVAVLISLGQHQFQQSNVLKQKNNKEAKQLKEKAHKNVSKALKLDPDNPKAQSLLFDMKEVK